VGGGDADLPEGVVEESRLLLRAALRRQTAEAPSSSSPWNWLNYWLTNVRAPLVQVGGAVALVLGGVLLGRSLTGAPVSGGQIAGAVAAEVLTVDNPGVRVAAIAGQVPFPVETHRLM